MLTNLHFLKTINIRAAIPHSERDETVYQCEYLSMSVHSSQRAHMPIADGQIHRSGIDPYSTT